VGRGVEFREGESVTLKRESRLREYMRKKGGGKNPRKQTEWGYLASHRGGRKRGSIKKEERNRSGCREKEEPERKKGDEKERNKGAEDKVLSISSSLVKH